VKLCLPPFLDTRENSIAGMNRPRNFRPYFLLTILSFAGLVELLREHRPLFLRPDLHRSAYVTADDGSVTVVDLVKLKAVARVAKTSQELPLWNMLSSHLNLFRQEQRLRCGVGVPQKNG
jgi:hypothetical protein